MTALPSTTALPRLRQWWPVYAQVFTLAAVINLLALAAPLFTLQVYDRVIAHAGLATLHALAIGMVLVLAFDLVLRGARARLLRGVAVDLDAKLADRLYGKIERLPFARLNALPNAALLARFRDVDVVRGAASAQSAALLVDVPFVVLYLVAVALVAPALLWLVASLAAAFVGLAVVNGVLVGRALERERALMHARDAHVLGMLEAKTTIKALNLAPALRGDWEARHGGALLAAAGRAQAQDGLQHLAQTLTVFASVVVTGVGALAVLDQRLTLGALIACNLLTARVAGTLFQLVGQWRAIAAGRDAARRLGTFLAEPEDRLESAVPLTQPRGRLGVEAVTFAYPSVERPIFERVDAAFGPGGLHVLVGANGAGKSTLLLLLQGLLAPDAGRVCLDGIDLRQLSVADRARWLAYVGPEPQAVGATLAASLLVGNEHADPARVRAAAAAAGLDEVVAALPHGYDTALGDGAARLSTGQLQRLALARAFLQEPAVLLFDEPTAHLDRDGERRLVASLQAFADKTTVIAASHGRGLIQAADTVVLVRAGSLSAARTVAGAAAVAAQ